MNKQQIKNAITALENARSILTGFNAWGRGAYARNNLGEDVNPTEADACRFCTLGALELADARMGLISGYHNAKKYLENVMEGDIIHTNDQSTTKHQHILMSYDLAILQANDDLKKAKV